MRLTRTLIIFAFLSVLTVQVAAQSACGTGANFLGFENRKSFTTNVLQRLEVKIALIEAVPPDVARYIDSEFELAMIGNNATRLQLVTANSFFPAHRARQAFQEFENKIKISESSNIRQQYAESLVDVLKKFLEFNDAFDTYRQFDTSRSTPVINSIEWLNIVTDLSFVSDFLYRALKCAIQEISGSK